MLLCLLVLAPMTVFSMPFDVKDEAATYSDDFARNKILPICAATDNDDPMVCLRNFFVQPEFQRRIDVLCSPVHIDRCKGFSAVDHGDKTIMLAFKGTDSAVQLLMESEETVFKNKTAWVAGGYVSKYFNDGFYALWNGGMKDDFLTLKNKYPGYELWIAGHSLGGSMASLCASYIAHLDLFDKSKIKLVTFGQPRTGDKDYAAAHDRDVAYSFRLIHAHDIVPHLPPNNLEQYRHHLTEVYYNNDMTKPDYKVCPKEESLSCSDGKLDTSVDEHSYYFNVMVSKWGRHGCKPE